MAFCERGFVLILHFLPLSLHVATATLQRVDSSDSCRSLRPPSYFSKHTTAIRFSIMRVYYSEAWNQCDGIDGKQINRSIAMSSGKEEYTY